MSARLKLTAVSIVAIAALVLAVAQTRRAWRGPSGGSDRDKLALVCMECNAVAYVSSAELEELPLDEDSGGVKCSSCGKLAAHVGTMRCPHCGEWVVRLPNAWGTPFECRHCRKSLASEPATDSTDEQ